MQSLFHPARRLGSHLRRFGIRRGTRVLFDHAALRSLRRFYGFAPWHADAPTSARPYRIPLAAMVDDLRPRSVVEVGCGLGSVLARVHAPERVGYDTDAAVIRAARRIRHRSIDFRVGGFDDVPLVPRDALIAVNMLHDFAPEQVAQWLARLLPTTRYLLVDRVERESPHAVPLLSRLRLPQRACGVAPVGRLRRTASRVPAV